MTSPLLIGYRRDPVTGWYVFIIPGFHPLNGYAWSGRDQHGRPNLPPGTSLMRRRLAMLWFHFKPIRWVWSRWNSRRYAVLRRLGR